MTQNRCESASCCTHPDESQRVLNRDGCLHVVCIECNTEIWPAELLESRPMTVIVRDVPTPGTGAPCGDDIPNRWGSPL